MSGTCVAEPYITFAMSSHVSPFCTTQCTIGSRKPGVGSGSARAAPAIARIAGAITVARPQVQSMNEISAERLGERINALGRHDERPGHEMVDASPTLP